MRVLSAERIGEDELLAALRRTPLRGFDGARPYAEATLELARATDPETLAPAQRYVLAENVARVGALRSALLTAHGIDVFALEGGVWVTTDEHPGARIPVLPPIVERSAEPGGRSVLLINDGIHRVFAARAAGLPITTVIARGVPPEYPYYAYALQDGWAGVSLLDALQDGFQKKAYRNPTGYKALFREFNAVFPGVQEQRAQTNPGHLTA